MKITNYIVKSRSIKSIFIPCEECEFRLNKCVSFEDCKMQNLIFLGERVMWIFGFTKTNFLIRNSMGCWKNAITWCHFRFRRASLMMGGAVATVAEKCGGRNLEIAWPFSSCTKYTYGLPADFLLRYIYIGTLWT
jgi:hypothetical protein